MARAPRFRRRPPGRARWLVALGVVALLAVACSPSGPEDPFDDADFQPGEEPELGPPPEEVNLPDTRGVVLAPVPGAGAAAVPVKIFGGEAALYGQVSTAEAGGSGGAVVRLERFVGFDSAVEEVPVAANGSWEADRLIGGRYRVRAYRAPDLAMISSEVFFLPAEDEVRLDLAVARFGGIDLQAAFLASGVQVGGSATVTALAQEVRVDGDGIVRGVPLAGATITADAGFGWSIEGAAKAVGADGLTSWTVTCTDAAAGDISISVAGTTTTVPAQCFEPEAAPLPIDPADTPPVSVVEVGERFTPPLDGPIAPGGYQVVESSGTCAIVYQRYLGGAWSPDRQTASGNQITLTSYARDIQPLGSSTPCTYERLS